jgi:hypothetical protein
MNLKIYPNTIDDRKLYLSIKPVDIVLTTHK